jgi:hypothetical protein
MEGYQNVIDKTFKDPIANLLLENSNMTRIQFETIVIDMLIDLMSEKRITFEEKTLFRENSISRGSFSRSLQQGRKNIIKSIFTIVLLSYIGVFDERPFDDYVFLAEKLRDYLDNIQQIKKDEKSRVLKSIERELLLGISDLISPRNIKIV